MTKHTPGPWRIGAPYGYLQSEITAREGNQVIGSIFTRRWDTRKDAPYLSTVPDPEGQANAALTVAASVLVEACEAAEQTLRNLAAGWLTGDTVVIATNEAASLRAAIALAEEDTR